MRALRAASPNKKKPARKSPKNKPAKTRYGYLIVQWAIVEDDIAQSGGGAILLGDEEEITISRSTHPKAELAFQENFERLRKDAENIIGSHYEVIRHNGNLFLSPKGDSHG